MLSEEKDRNRRKRDDEEEVAREEENLPAVLVPDSIQNQGIPSQVDVFEVRMIVHDVACCDSCVRRVGRTSKAQDVILSSTVSRKEKKTHLVLLQETMN